MGAVARRSLAARKLRTVLTAVAILLGVAMVSGAYIETDQIRSAFDDIVNQQVEGLDVVVSPPEKFTSSFAEMPTLPRDLTAEIRNVEGVRAAEAEMTAFGQIIVDGEPIETNGAPPLVFAASSDPFDPTTISEGHDPAAPGEAAILAQNAEDNGIALGDEIGVATRNGEKQVTVVGFVNYGEGGSSALGGTTGVSLYRPQFDRWFDFEGKASAISVIGEPGIDPQTLADRIKAVLGNRAKVQTAEQSARETSEQIDDQLGSFLTPALLTLAGAAVLVGAFIIFNTFSITVAQRVREFALLRAIGATRRQVLASVTIEALVIGLGASVVGLVAGVGISRLLNALFDAVGFGIPHSGLVLETRTIVAAFAVGVGATLFSSLIPALRATRISPVAAMAGTTALRSHRRRRISAAISVLLTAVGLLLVAQGLFGGGPATSRLSAIAGGAVIIFIGIALSARFLVRPLASVIGWPIERLRGAIGRLARENTIRNPGRTAVTSAALMIGLGLVVFVAVFASALKSSITGQVDRLISADMIAYGEGFQPFSERTVPVIEGVRGVGTVAEIKADQVEVNGEKSNVATDVVLAVDPAKIGEVYDFDWVDGDDSLLSRLGRGDVLIEEQFAKTHDIAVGDTYRVTSPTGESTTLRAIGEYRDPTVLQGSIASFATLHSFSQARDAFTILIKDEPGTDLGTVEKDVKAALDRFPTLKVENHEEYEDTISGQLNQIVYMLYALLAMSVVISLFGIANSLFLSIHERTNEIGIVRAIGGTREQVRRMIRYESVITAVIGGLLGTVVGIAFAAIMVASLSEFGLHLSIPVVQLVVFLLLAVLVGVIGAIAPARKAARMDVLRAIEHG
jgi:putative ABC transport system permease protein